MTLVADILTRIEHRMFGWASSLDMITDTYMKCGERCKRRNLVSAATYKTIEKWFAKRYDTPVTRWEMTAAYENRTDQIENSIGYLAVMQNRCMRREARYHREIS